LPVFWARGLLSDKQCVTLCTPCSPWSSRRRPCTRVERLVALRIVAQPDRQGQLGKADRRRVVAALVGWLAGLSSGSARLALVGEIARWALKEGFLLSMLAVTAHSSSQSTAADFLSSFPIIRSQHPRSPQNSNNASPPRSTKSSSCVWVSPSARMRYTFSEILLASCLNYCIWHTLRAGPQSRRPL